MGEQAEITMALLPLTMIDPNKVSTIGKIVLRAQAKEVVGCLTICTVNAYLTSLQQVHSPCHWVF